ncbi:MAG: hypothetical protein ACI9R3_003844 [Verrucomicrobiales bacterium]
MTLTAGNSARQLHFYGDKNGASPAYDPELKMTDTGRTSLLGDIEMNDFLCHL